MSRYDPLERILTSLHEAALDPVQWPHATGLIEDACGLRGNALVVCSGITCSRKAILFAHFCFGGRRDEDLERKYFRDYFPGDERIPRLKRLRDGRLVPTGDLYADREKETSATYNELFGDTEMERGFHVRFKGTDLSETFWALGNCSETRGWSAAQIDGIERLLPVPAGHSSVAPVRVVGPERLERFGNGRQLVDGPWHRASQVRVPRKERPSRCPTPSFGRRRTRPRHPPYLVGDPTLDRAIALRARITSMELATKVTTGETNPYHPRARGPLVLWIIAVLWVP